ncbi:MAG: hypothetical protein PHC50_04585 [Candidatus Cloacimonetes bacterium]|nr:hypothetical protein [Candidatus Cloacimonadota bacterium]
MLKDTFQFAPRYRPEAVFVAEQEIFGELYQVYKYQILSPPSNNFRLFRERDDYELLGCTMTFTLHVTKSDKNFLNDYAIADQAIAQAMFEHLKRNLLQKQNALQIRKIKLEADIERRRKKIEKKKEKGG